MTKPVVNLPHEVWASIPGYPGYWVSSEGRVRSRRGVLKPHPNSGSGRLEVQLSRRGERRTQRTVHQLVAGAFIGPRPAGQLTRHKNDVHSDNRATNLEYGTYADNYADAKRNGRRPLVRPHGTPSRYKNGYCRCPRCTAAHAANMREYRARKKENPA
ncbi:NUMOD4 motif-containing HNH endonuclease [Microbacterium sp. AK031]|uniref:NUMOD4 motif-containing HNH endonuclease n=1 Tax=Microbacterium sp. AK031 TaxID=2723076 RepID=UPI0021692F18|nr:NUMOD4 motif-containing HNH endonuclease [Microbacterium sp. AK031]MCS3844805.1 hypothetical protein [Microbacterium sp. AK031]